MFAMEQAGLEIHCATTCTPSSGCFVSASTTQPWMGAAE